MKMKRYEDIEPSNRTTFRMLYYNAGRTLTQIETLLKRTYGNPLPIKPQDRLFRIRHKLEQMVARYKQCENELKAEYQWGKEIKNLGKNIMPKYPEIPVKIIGKNGNAFNILCICLRAMHRAGLSQEECDAFQAEATSGNYEHLLNTCIKWFSIE